MTFENIGNLKNEISTNQYKIKLSDLTKEINLFENFIIVNNNNNFTIYDRVCDHAGGKIICKNNEYICPMHAWKFDPINGFYNNGVKKNKINYIIKKNELLFKVNQKIPIINKINKDEKLKIRFINHAFVIFSGESFKFAIDPWAVGPAFNTGWWLSLKTKNDWVEQLNSCDFIFVSHNHPDHLNKHTLKYVKNDMQFVVPKYSTDSTGIFIETLGFKNIFRANFKTQYKFKNSNLIFSILKSGDFRDDSGIYFSVGNFSTLFDVDTNNINFNNLPKTDLYGSSFAGGASGYPLMFSNYSEEQKKAILINNKKSLKIFKQNSLKKISPTYFLPYAGFFKEALERDSYININNKKNNILDYEKICKKISCKLLNVEKFDEFYFHGKKLISQKNRAIEYYKDTDYKSYLNKIKKTNSKIDIDYIYDYFKNSKFKDNLIVKIELTDDNFKNIDFNIVINFSNDRIKIELNSIEDVENFNKEGLRFLNLKCRKESFLNTIYNKEPWEDLTIGFQCLIYRNPNIYNVDFWYHFSNVYVTKKNVRGSTNCNNCDRIVQNLDSEIKNPKIRSANSKI